MSSNKRGFTLIETVIAMALASAGLAAVYQVYASSARAERAATEADAAANLLETLMYQPEIGGSGEAGSFSWTTERGPVAGTDQLEEITLRLTAESGREFALRFERALESEDE